MNEIYTNEGLATFDAYLMHWGRPQGDPRAPGPGSGRYRKGTGKKYEKQTLKNRIAAKKLAKQQTAEKLERAQNEFNKERVMKSGSREEVMANAKYLTNDELKQAIERVNTMERFSKEDPALKNAKDTFNKIDDVMKKAQTVSNWMNTGMNLWNNMATLNNTLNPDHPMIKINGTPITQQRKSFGQTQQQDQQNNNQQKKQ